MTSHFKLRKNLFTELTLLAAAALSIFYGNINIYILILSVTVHELGHIISALLVGAKTNNFSVHGFGVEINFPGKTPSAKKMLLISSAGPVASIILALIGYKTNNYMLFITNLSVAFVNLFPVYPLDGGNIIYSLLSPYITRKKLYQAMRLLGKVFGIIISICGIIILFSSGINISLLYMGLFIFFSANRLNNPVVEIYTAEYPKIEKSVLFSIDNTVPLLEAAGSLPANSIGAIKDKTGKIISLVTPLYLYNQEIEKSRS